MRSPKACVRRSADDSARESASIKLALIGSSFCKETAPETTHSVALRLRDEAPIVWSERHSTQRRATSDTELGL